VLPALESVLPLDDEIIRPILSSPVEAFCIASAGALSSSAFVLPVLKQKGWENRPDGTATLAILLLQDLAVAPLLVILPLVAGSGPQDPAELGVLVGKATFGFAGVLAVGSYVLQQVFAIVAAARSTETFVAAALLVAVGMGWAAEELGLSASTGAFAAGVLLAGSKYRAQIEADIKPFEGILLGVFFMTAGANLDPALCLREFPTLLTGILVIISLKIGVLFTAGEFALGLSRAEAMRIAILLAGGGEFAFVVFKLAQDLGVLPDTLAKLLTASVIVSMSLTPLLGELAEVVGDAIESVDAEKNEREYADQLFDTIDADGDGFITGAELRKYLLGASEDRATENLAFAELFTKLDIDNNSEISREELRKGYKIVTGAERTAAISESTAVDTEKTAVADAIVVCGFGEMGQRVCEVLDAASKATATEETGGGYEHIAFDRNPSRVTLGLMDDKPVVYGDGASADLLRAAGVKEPKAVVVTYANPKRCLEATGRLREAFPAAPIYVRARWAEEAPALMQAGATDVVFENVETSLRLSSLLGVGTAQLGAAEVGLLSRLRALPSASADATGEASPYSPEELTRLAEVCGASVSQVEALYRVFTTLDADASGEVEKSEIRDMLGRLSANPIDDASLDQWMAEADADGSGTVDFEEYVRVSVKASSLPDQVAGYGV